MGKFLHFIKSESSRSNHKLLNDNNTYFKEPHKYLYNDNIHNEKENNNLKDNFLSSLNMVNEEMNHLN